MKVATKYVQVGYARLVVPQRGDAGFEAHKRWRSGHLQTIRSQVIRPIYDSSALGSERAVLIPMNDGSNDQLKVRIHCSRYVPAKGVGGLVVLVHGLGGSIESSYMRATTVGLLRAGFNVARVDLRGAGESAETCSLLYHAGRTEDLRTVITALAEEPEASDNAMESARIAIVGFSLGGGMTLKLLGEPQSELVPFAGVAVSAPIDLVAGSIYLRQAGLGLYEKLLVANLKRQALNPSPNGTQRVSHSEASAVKQARTLAEFDDVLTAPRNGWRDSAEYYAVNSANQFLPSIATPTMVIHALDDPMIPSLPYRAVDWQGLESKGYVKARITERGGHVGFHQRDDDLPWFVGEVVDFLSLRPLSS